MKWIIIGLTVVSMIAMILFVIGAVRDNMLRRNSWSGATAKWFPGQLQETVTEVRELSLTEHALRDHDALKQFEHSMQDIIDAAFDGLGKRWPWLSKEMLLITTREWPAVQL